MSVSMSRPVSWSWFCHACRKRLAAAKAGVYSGSGTGGAEECLLLASTDVDKNDARDRIMSGKTRRIPDNRPGATNSRFTHELCGKRRFTPITTEVLSTDKMEAVVLASLRGG